MMAFKSAAGSQRHETRIMSMFDLTGRVAE